MSRADERCFPTSNDPLAAKTSGLPQMIALTAGLTKREYFAGLALQGLLSAVYSSKEMLDDFTVDKSGGYARHVSGREAVSVNAVSYADALLAELAKGREG